MIFFQQNVSLQDSEFCVIVSHQELGGVGRRFEHQLTSDVHHLADATSVGSKIVCCYTLGRERLPSFTFFYE